MRKKVLFILIVFGSVLYRGAPQAAELDDLREEIQELREDYEAKIQKLEERIDALSKEQSAKVEAIEKKVKKDLLDVEYVGRYEGPFGKGGLLIKNPSGFGNVSVGGYMDHEFEDFQNTNATFDQHRWIINIGAELRDRLRFYSEYEIEHGGPDASGGGEAKVEQAWLDYLIADWINLRAGAILVPFGRYNLYHDSDLQDLTDRPIVDRDIIPTTWTEAGAGLYGEFNPVIGDYEDLILAYEAYVINGLGTGFSDTGLRGARGSIEKDNNGGKSLVGRLVMSPYLGHEVGISSYWGRYNGSEDDIIGGAIDWFSSWGPLELVGEYAYFDVEAAPGSNIASYFTGYYIQANYHFWPEFLTNTFLGRNFDAPTFTLVARYDWAKIDDDSDANRGNNKEERFTVGFNYRPVESWVFKTEYQWNSSRNERLERGDNDGFITSVAMGF